MKKTLVLAAASAFLAFAGIATAQNHATGTGNASARIIKPISVEQDEPLKFGTFFSGNTSGTVHITSASSSGTGTRSVTGGVTPYNGSQGLAFHQAEWDVNGEVGFLYTISGISGTHTVSSGSHSMSYTFDEPHANGTVGVIGTDPVPDKDDLFYGATLTVPANQTSGTYTGTYNLTATYN